MNPGSLGSGAFLDVVLVLLDADSMEGTWLGMFAAPACGKGLAPSWCSGTTRRTNE